MILSGINCFSFSVKVVLPEAVPLVRLPCDSDEEGLGWGFGGLAVRGWSHFYRLKG